MKPRTAISLALGLAALTALGSAPSLGASGCSRERCVPRTGAWSAPSPQKLTFFGQPAPLTLRVAYVRNGKWVKSRYGNTVRNLGAYLRYYCPEGGNIEWVETGFSTSHQAVTLDRDGKAKTKIRPYLSQPEHRLVLRFARTTFTGRLSGSVTADDGSVCSTSVSFSGKRK